MASWSAASKAARAARKACVTRLYRKIHPDLLHNAPAHSKINQHSLQQLHFLLDLAAQPPRALTMQREHVFEFFCRTAASSPKNTDGALPGYGAVVEEDDGHEGDDNTPTGLQRVVASLHFPEAQFPATLPLSTQPHHLGPSPSSTFVLSLEGKRMALFNQLLNSLVAQLCERAGVLVEREVLEALVPPDSTPSSPRSSTGLLNHALSLDIRAQFLAHLREQALDGVQPEDKDQDQDDDLQVDLHAAAQNIDINAEWEHLSSGTKRALRRVQAEQAPRLHAQLDFLLSNHHVILSPLMSPQQRRACEHHLKRNMPSLLSLFKDRWHGNTLVVGSSPDYSATHIADGFVCVPGDFDVQELESFLAAHAQALSKSRSARPRP